MLKGTCRLVDTDFLFLFLLISYVCGCLLVAEDGEFAYIFIDDWLFCHLHCFASLVDGWMLVRERGKWA